MKLTRGERRSLVLYLFVLAGFLPPVIILFNRADVKVFGMPLLLFWVGLMVLLTSVLMSLALFIKNRSDEK